jgi:hypothetical protein
MEVKRLKVPIRLLHTLVALTARRKALLASITGNPGRTK